MFSKLKVGKVREIAQCFVSFSQILFSFSHLRGYLQVAMKFSDVSVIFHVDGVLVNYSETESG